MLHEFLTAWTRFRPGAGPKLLNGDELLLDPGTGRRLTIEHPSWSHYLKQNELGNVDQRHFHVSLIPQPFFGNVDSAPVVILTLNPGFSPMDYYAEFHVKDYRKALIDNLRLTFRKSRFPNVFLNPDFSWHPGFKYWHGRLARLIDRFVEQTGVKRIEALSQFSKSIAILELIPYHSVAFGLSERVMSKLRSVRLAREFAKEVLLPRARASQKLLIVARQASRWNLKEERGVVVYKGSETLAAYLSPSSRGGSAILKHLLRQWKNRS